MTKIMLNRCYGGYHWSIKGTYAVLKRKGISPKFMARIYPKPGEPQVIEVAEADFFRIDECINTEERYEPYCGPNGVYVSDIFFMLPDGNSCNGYLDREDNDAIAVLELLGSEYCSDKHSSLYIDEYDKNDYIADIDEYDGSEDLVLAPRITESRIRACRDIDGVIDLLKKFDVLVRE